MCDAATVLLHLASLAAESRLQAGEGSEAPAAQLVAVEQAQDLMWHLCDALGSVQALMDRRGRFVQVCCWQLLVHRHERYSVHFCAFAAVLAAL